MRISDWSSDVCSSDLEAAVQGHRTRATGLAQHVLRGGGVQRPEIQLLLIVDLHAHLFARAGRRLRGKREHAAGRERGEVVAAAIAVVLAELRIDVQAQPRSEEHTSELQSLMRISYAVFCLKKKKSKRNNDIQLKTQ